MGSLKTLLSKEKREREKKKTFDSHTHSLITHSRVIQLNHDNLTLTHSCVVVFPHLDKVDSNRCNQPWKCPVLSTSPVHQSVQSANKQIPSKQSYLLMLFNYPRERRGKRFNKKRHLNLRFPASNHTPYISHSHQHQNSNGLVLP